MTIRFSPVAVGALIAGVALTTLPLGRADVAIAGFVTIWFAFYLFMRRAGPTLRYWATLMAALGGWFVLASVSGSLARWTHRDDAPVVQALEPAKVTTTGADLKADVRFTGEQFVISNKGRQPWEDISLSLKAATAPGYTLHVDRVAAGRTLTVPPSRFVAADGQAFDAARVKPQSLVIAAHVGNTGPGGAIEVRW